MKKVAIVIGSIIVILLVVGLALPSKQHVERSVVINAPPEAVFDLVNNLETFLTYSPFTDPTMKIEWGSKRVGLGASYSWKGEKSGEGTMTIVESRRPEYVSNNLDFKKGGLAKGYFRLEKTDVGTRVTWGFDGDSGMDIPRRYLGFFMMDKFLGKLFEQGLASMKEIAEKQKMPR